MLIIPAIDILDGRCVRLTKGDYDSQRVYSDDPVSVARSFEAHGATQVHIVDLDGARAKHVVNDGVLRDVARGTGLRIDFGGGVKSDDDLRLAFDAGAAQVTAGSIAVTDPERVKGWVSTYGAERIIIGADVRDGQISINGWTDDGGVDLFSFVDEYTAAGATHFLCTDIQRDGMLQGPAVDLYSELLRRHPGLYLIASGGVGCTDDLRALDAAGLPAAIVGKALYEGRIPLENLGGVPEISRN